MFAATYESVAIGSNHWVDIVSAGSGGQWGANSATAGVYAACMKLREAVAQKLGFNSGDIVFAGGKVRLNLSAFYYDYKGLQLSRIVARTSVNDNTDAEIYGGSGMGNLGAIETEEVASHGRSYSARITVPPLATVWFLLEEKTRAE